MEIHLAIFEKKFFRIWPIRPRSNSKKVGEIHRRSAQKTFHTLFLLFFSAYLESTYEIVPDQLGACIRVFRFVCVNLTTFS